MDWDKSAKKESQIKNIKLKTLNHSSLSVKLKYFMGSEPSVDLFDNCLSQARHRIARQRPTSLLSWSTGNERGEEESKLLPGGGWGKNQKAKPVMLF